MLQQDPDQVSSGEPQVWVQGMPLDSSVNEVWDLFNKWPGLVDVRMSTNRATRSSKGFAFLVRPFQTWGLGFWDLMFRLAPVRPGHAPGLQAESTMCQWVTTQNVLST